VRTKKTSKQETSFCSPNSSVSRSSEPVFPIDPTGQVLSNGTTLDLIKEAGTGRTRLLVFDGKCYATVDRFEGDGRIYTAPELDPSLSEAVPLPTDWQPYGTTEALFDAAKSVLTDHGFSADAALASAYFEFASWFPKRALPPPCLTISGPLPEALLFLQLVGCMVWRGMPIVGLDSTHFCAIVGQLFPTLLIDARHLSAGSLRILLASCGPNAFVASKNSVVDFAVAKAIYVGPAPSSKFSLGFSVHIHLAPQRNGIRMLDEKARQQIIARFQPMFLNYKIRNLTAVRACTFDLPALDSENQVIATVLGGCIVNASGIQSGVGPLLQDREDQIREARFVDLTFVTVEVLLALCHGRQQDEVAVKEIATAARIVLKGRGETIRLKPRKVGSILDSLSVPRKRGSRGFRVLLTDAVRRRLHSLARDHQVEPVRERTADCALCKEIFGTVTDADRGKDVHGNTRVLTI
jgi:hypothetical protein